MTEKLLAVDPGSRVVGYACFDDGVLVEAGKITPEKASASAIPRTRSIRSSLKNLLAEYQPMTCIIEVPSGKQHRRIRGRAAGLTIYGFAAGGLWDTLLTYGEWRLAAGSHCPVVEVADNVWTMGKTKRQRQAMIAVEYRRKYNPDDDKGADVADAIGIGLWYLQKRKEEEIKSMNDRAKKYFA